MVVPVECVARPVSDFLAMHTRNCRSIRRHAKVACLDFAFVCVCVYPGPINDLFLLLKEMMTNAVVIRHCVLLLLLLLATSCYIAAVGVFTSSTGLADR